MTALDWDVAARRAGQIAPAGPTASRVTLKGVVESLRRSAEHAPELVGEITGLHAAAASAAAVPVYVVDRPRWSEANVAIFRGLLHESMPPASAGSARVAAEELGLLLALLSSRVLGQFDPFSTPARLLLVAPNIVAVERDLDLDVMDFRLWVCLHEQTHAVQFAAAPWLAAHIAGRIGGMATRLADPGTGPDRLRIALTALIDVLRNRGEGASLLHGLLSPEEQRELDAIIAVMSLLEGHADLVMDAVGPARLPSVRRIRASFERRRDGAGPFDLVVRRILGMDAKLAQYRNGGVFVRGVLRTVGHAGLNAVWASPGNLPTQEEIAQPQRWVARVHG
ncbi:MAG: hypothetical protein GX427_03190 [Actinomycetales bacterium]|nr:hypothetical protein [Actinomycetales bacterium]